MESAEAPSAASRAARKLADLFASIEVQADWPAVEKNAQLLANELRVQNGSTDDRTLLGKTLLPQTLTSLLKRALDGSHLPDVERADAVFELLRVGANLCMDHNENRAALLDAGFPQELATLLESYADMCPDIPGDREVPLSEIQLKTVRTIVGALLNLTTDFEPIRIQLTSLETPSILLKLFVSLFPPGYWRTSVKTLEEEELWNIRKVIADWSLRAIANFKDTQMEQQLFGPESLAFMTFPLQAFIPSPNMTASSTVDEESQDEFLATDLDVVEEVCALLESATMDVEDVRTSLARGLSTNERPHCFSTMLDFIEQAQYPHEWVNSIVNHGEVAKMKRVLDLCKTAVIRAVVEVSGEDDNLNILWDIRREESGFISRLLRWIKEAHDVKSDTVKDDLVICATLCLGNMVRGETQANTLSTPPISIASLLVPFLTPKTDFKLKHGVIALLKHISQTASTRQVLGEARILQALRTCRVFDEASDISVVVQMSAINLTKHLCTHNVSNSIVCVTDSDGRNVATTCLNQILQLSRRSDSIHVKSEGARVLVNVIRSLCSSAGDVQDESRRKAIELLITPENSVILAQLLGRSQKHGILLNEAIVAMCLLSLQKEGAGFVLDALISDLPKEVSPSHQNSVDAEASDAKPDAGAQFMPTTALDMLVHIMENADNKFPAELRSNSCTLLINMGNNIVAESENRKEEISRVSAAVRPTLESLKSTPDSLYISVAAEKALSAWS